MDLSNVQNGAIFVNINVGNPPRVLGRKGNAGDYLSHIIALTAGTVIIADGNSSFTFDLLANDHIKFNARSSGGPWTIVTDETATVMVVGMFS